MTDYSETMSFDLKKFRIRIHKSTIRAIGDPRYIHLLVSPDKKSVGVKACFDRTPDKDAHRVNQYLMESDNSYEIYSSAFVKKLCKELGQLDENVSYRIKGRIVPSEQMAVYSLATVARIEQ